MSNKSSTGALLLLSEIMEMDQHTSKKIGFAEIYKVDQNTFTIKSIDEEEFVNSINKELVDELIVEDDCSESP